MAHQGAGNEANKVKLGGLFGAESVLRKAK